MALTAFVRIATNRKTFPGGPSPSEAFAVCEAILDAPAATLLRAGPSHWAIFRRLVLESGVSGPDITDAYFAALAIEHDAEFVTFDRGFARFPGLRRSEPPPV